MPLLLLISDKSVDKTPVQNRMNSSFCLDLLHFSIGNKYEIKSNGVPVLIPIFYRKLRKTEEGLRLLRYCGHFYMCFDKITDWNAFCSVFGISAEAFRLFLS